MSKQINNHSPLPWRFDGEDKLVDNNGDEIIVAVDEDGPGINCPNDEAFILHACNTYYKREDLLKRTVKYIEDAFNCATIVVDDVLFHDIQKALAEQPLGKK